MRDFIIKNKIINSNQYGFIGKTNTTASHISVQNVIFSKQNTNKKIATVFFDLKKAFDVKDHSNCL